MSITLIHNKFDIDAVITAAFYLSYMSGNKLHDIMYRKSTKQTVSVESTSGVIIDPVMENYYVFLGIKRVDKKFKDFPHVRLNTYFNDISGDDISGDYDSDTGEVVTIFESLTQNLVEKDNEYVRQLVHALKVFNTRSADEKDLMVLSKYYQMALKVLRYEGVFEFSSLNKEDEKEYKEFIKKVKREFSNNFSKNHPLPIQEGLNYPAASISSDCCVWVRRFMRLVHNRYLNVILTTKGHIVDTDIPDIQDRLKGRNFILSSDY